MGPKLRRFLWWTGTLTAAATSAVVGYLAVWFQLFGEQADSEDYRVGAGAFFAGFVILACAGFSAWYFHRERALVISSCSLSGLLLLAMGQYLAQATTVEQRSTPIDGFWDGFGGVVLTPWTWPFIFLAMRGCYGLARYRRRA